MHNSKIKHETMATPIMTDAEPEFETDAEPEVETKAEPEADPEAPRNSSLTIEELELYMEKHIRHQNWKFDPAVMERLEERIAHPGNNMATIDAAFRDFGKEMDLKFRHDGL
jgi:hypothetical protein